MDRDDIGIVPLSQAFSEAHIGDRQAEGMVFAGISPDTGKPLFVRPKDESLTMRWRKAINYAKFIKAHGKKRGTFRLPTPREMRMILDHHEKIPGLEITKKFEGPENYYWTSKQPPPDHYSSFVTAWAEHFMGRAYSDYWPTYDKSSVRLVCD